MSKVWPFDLADKLLASAWLALSGALDHAPSVRCADGNILLSLGGGNAATLEITSTSTDTGRCRAMLDCLPGSYRDATITTEISSGVDHVKYTVPIGLELLGGRTRVCVEFSASPLLMGLPLPACLLAAATTSSHDADD